MPREALSEENEIGREAAINLVLASIAMEELGMSHILNAEGEKLQYAMGTLENGEAQQPVSVETLLHINKSVRDTLSLTMQNQLFLSAKMGSVLSIPTMQGPQGPEGPQGPVGPMGPEGPRGKLCAIIPFASGEAEYITSSTGGGKSGVVSLGFGERYQIPLQLAEYIDVPAASGAAQCQLAFSMPDGGIIRSMSAFFCVTSSALLDNVVHAQLYATTATPPGNRFYPIAGAEILFSVAAFADVGTGYTGSVRDIDFPVSAETRLLMVFYNTTPAGITSTLSGFMSGGVKIEEL